MSELDKLGKVMIADVLVLGCGIGGMTTALKIKKIDSSIDVLCIEKDYFGYNGQTTKAGHGFFYMSPEDDVDAFCKEQVEINDTGIYLNDQEYMYDLTRAAKTYVGELEELGAVFAHNADGTLHYHREFAEKKCSAVNIDLDFVTPVSRNALANGVRVVERIYFTDLLTEGGHVVGAVGFNVDTTEFYIFRAKAVVLVSGDFNAVVRAMFHAPATPIMAAYEAGAQLRNVEQHTEFDLCYRNTGNYIYGAHMVVFNQKGENIFQKYHVTDLEIVDNKMMLAMLNEVKEGNGPLYVDFSKLPSTSETEGEGFNMGMVMPHRIGMDAVIFQNEGERTNNPEVSLQTYLFSRCLRTNIEAKTTIPNLWAIGMITMMGASHGSWVHGDGVGYAARTALLAAKSIVPALDNIELGEVDVRQVKTFKERIYAPYNYKGKDLPYHLVNFLYRLICQPEYTVAKTEESLHRILDILKQEREELPNNIYVPKGDGHYLAKAIEARTMIDMLEIIFLANDARKESRGHHMRVDYPNRDDKNWLKWIIVTRGKDGRPGLSFERVPLERYKWKPEGWMPDWNTTG
jgi:succinate dehydrogenase/fumarate reductase flavoprotein subunit